MRHEIEDVFLKIGAGAADAVNLVLADHLGQRQAQFAVLMAPPMVTNIFPPEASSVL
jgi:hypothetical protein